MTSTLEQLNPGWEEARRRAEFWNDNYDRLLAEYPEQYVAVDPISGEVISSDPDLVVLIERMRRRGLESPRDVTIELISQSFRSMIL